MKERIQDKAKDLFHRYGFKSVTMDEIASQLGVSKKTIYQYYSDKDELVEAVIRHLTSFSRQLCDQSRASSKDAVHELFLAMDIVQQILADMNPSMMYDLQRSHPNAYNVFLDFRNKYLQDMIISNLKKGIEEGLYRPDINTEIFAKMRLEGLMLGFNQDIFPPSKFNLAEAQKITIEHFLFGVATLKGYHLILKYKEESLKS
ncbi:MAG: TetR/AcrR family transcriptional regulator [Chitinophagaceae bacterium]|nr:TetR/AcrR family transcriptional regulator [Chitinophagaceae bacterium]